MEQKYRYPGAKPFTIEEKELFFGRDEDIEKLYRLISLEKLVVLFGKSGLGKSSLINAGIYPKFYNDNNSRFYNIRLGSYNKLYDEGVTLKEKLIQNFWLIYPKNEFGEKKKFYLNEIINKENSLWYFLKKNQYRKSFINVEKYIIVLDQFEELFTYPEEQIIEFKKELSNTINTQIPNNFRTEFEKKIKENPDLFQQHDKEFFYKPLEIKIIFSIRSDKMSLLNNLKDYFPAILQNCYEVKALKKEQAEDAILIPAGYNKSDIQFSSKPFTYSNEALDKILNFLTQGAEKSIESFQLQILCQYTEQISSEKKIRTIEENHLGNLENIYKNYYDSIISKLDVNEQLPARKFIEEGLIFEEEHRRISLYEGQIYKQFGISKDLLFKLVNTHILRSEPNTSGGFSYELSHDTLVSPILQAKAKRLEDFLRQQSELKRLEEEKILFEKLEKERLEKEKEIKNKRQRTIILLVSFFAIVSILLAVFGLWQMNIAKKQSKIANEQTKIAKEKAAEADSLRLIAVKNENTAVEKADEATNSFKEAEFQKLIVEKQAIQLLIEKGKAENSFFQALLAKKESDSLKIIAVNERTDAVRERDNAQKQKSLADSLLIVAMYQTARAEKLSKFANVSLYSELSRQELNKNPSKSFDYALQAFENDKDDQKAVFALLNSYNNVTEFSTFNANINSNLKSAKIIGNGSKILAVTGDTAFYFLDFLGNVTKTFNNIDNKVDFVDIDDSLTIIVSGDKENIKIWNKDAELISQISTNKKGVTSLDVSSDGKNFIVGFDDSKVIVFDKDGKTKVNLTFDKQVSCVKIDNKNNIIIAASSKNLYLYDISGNKITNFFAHSSEIKSVDYNAVNNLILSVSDDKSIKLWLKSGDFKKLTSYYKRLYLNILFVK